MKRTVLQFSIIFLLYSIAVPTKSTVSAGQSILNTAISSPVLLWSNKGCESWGCNTGWYSSPAVADIDEDGSQEVIGGAYSVVILDAKTGALKKRLPASGSRLWPGIVVADLEGDGHLEIVAATGGGWVFVYDHHFNLKWSRQPTPGNELRSLAAYDLEGDGNLEILVASTTHPNQWWVYESDGSLRPGWPQKSNSSSGNAAGCYNENISVGDINQDNLAEIIGSNDTHYMDAFHANGNQVVVNSRYTDRQYWSQVGVHVSDSVDVRGYAYCGTEHRPNFADSAPVVFDVNHDGVLETIVVGNVYNCGTNPYTDLYHTPFIFNADRTRFAASGFSWVDVPPSENHPILSEDYNRIETALPNPVVVDLDSDGFKEILYSSYDGYLHTYWLNKTEHPSGVTSRWPYSVNNVSDGYITFASEPVVANLDNDPEGHAEVIFTTWTEKGKNHSGKLMILDYLGNLLSSVALPLNASKGYDGALPAPTLADIDGDSNLEVVVNTINSGLAAYRIPNTANAKILWGTGRYSYFRSGSILPGNLIKSLVVASPGAVNGGSTVTVTFSLRNTGDPLTSSTFTHTIPSMLLNPGGLLASAGNIVLNNRLITWTGTIPASSTVMLTYTAQVDPTIIGSSTITLPGHVESGSKQWNPAGFIIVNPLRTYLPSIGRP